MYIYRELLPCVSIHPDSPGTDSHHSSSLYNLYHRFRNETNKTPPNKPLPEHLP
jgi:hypothetical protein